MTGVCDEADVGLAGAGHIEDREVFPGLKKRKELLQTAALAGLRRRILQRALAEG